MGRFPSGQREQTVNLPSQTSMVRIHPRPPFFLSFAGMAELADALDSGSSESNFMQVQVLFPAPDQYNPNQIFQIGNGFGFFLIFLSQRHNTPDLAGKFSVLKGGTLLESLRTSIQRNCHFLIYKHKAVFSFGNMVYLAQ